MEIFSILLKILGLVLVIFGQIVGFVFKLVPVGLFLTLIENFMIGGKQITQLLVETNYSVGFMLCFIFFSAYLILIGLLHLVVNINVFKNSIEFENGKQSKKYEVSFDVIKTFRSNFLSAITSLKKNNQGEHILSSLKTVKNNILLRILFFQGGIGGHKHFKSIFDGITSKGIGFNIFLILAIIGASWYALTYEKEYIGQNGEIVSISNGYEYLKNSISYLDNDYLGKGIQYLSNGISEQITFRDRRIQAISKLYYYSTLMNVLGGVDLISTQEKFINFGPTTEGGNFNDLSSSGTGNGGISGKEGLSLFLGKSIKKDSVKDSVKDLGYNGIYFDEFMNSIFNTKATKYIKGSEMKTCLNEVNKNKDLKSKYFIDETLYNSRIFNQYLAGKLVGSSTKKGIENFDLTMNDLKSEKGLSLLSEHKVNGTLGKYGFAIPGKTKDGNLIGLNFILGKKGNYYVVDKDLYSKFISTYQTGTYQVGSSYQNPELLYTSNSKIVDFCYGYSLLSQYKRKGTIGGKETKYGGIVYQEYNYEKVLEEAFTSIASSIKNESISDKDLLQVSWYLLSHTDFYLRDTLQNTNSTKDFENLSRYFYMFDGGKNRSFEYLIGGTISGLYQNTNSMIDSLSFATINSKNTVEENMKQKQVKDIVGRYSSVNKSINDYQGKIVSTIKEKFDVLPSSKIFNELSLQRLKRIYFQGYKQENLEMGGNVLGNGEIGNLLIGINNKIDEDDISLGKSQDGTTQEVLFFGKEFQLSKQLGEGSQYKKVGIMMGIIPIIESQLGFMNFILFGIYIVVYIIIMFLLIWFSGIGQFLKNYAEYKQHKDENEFNFVQEIIDLLVRFVIFIILMKLYFIFTIF